MYRIWYVWIAIDSRNTVLRSHFDYLVCVPRYKRNRDLGHSIEGGIYPTSISNLTNKLLAFSNLKNKIYPISNLKNKKGSISHLNNYLNLKSQKYFLPKSQLSKIKFAQSHISS